VPPPALGARYAWQAGRLAAREGRDGSAEKPWPTAQPYGINTPGAFAMVFSVMLPVYVMERFVLGNAPEVAYPQVRPSQNSNWYRLQTSSPTKPARRDAEGL
jgi:hypothetical protein